MHQDFALSLFSSGTRPSSPLARNEIQGMNALTIFITGTKICGAFLFLTQNFAGVVWVEFAIAGSWGSELPLTLQPLSLVT